MSTIKCNLLLLSVLIFGTQSSGQTPGQRAQKPTIDQSNPHYLQYRGLVERAKNGDPEVDLVQLISAASDWDLAQPLVEAPDRDLMVEAFKKKDYKQAVKLAEAVLDYEFTNRSLHLATANAYKYLGDPVRSDLHRNLAEKILSALLSTGDGKTTQTAFCVQGINEEYLIMRHFGYQVLMQAYLVLGEVDYDLLSGKDEKTGKEVGLYFDISGHFTRCVQSHQQKKS